MKIAIIGGGSSGLFCAGLINESSSVVIYEKNETLGRKLLLTGNGRCNVTNLKSSNEFLNNVITNSKFLLSALNNFSPYDLYDYISKDDIELIEEEENKIYPKSGKAKIILDFFISKLKSNVLIKTSSTVTNIIKENDGYYVVTNNEKEFYDKVIIATGGKSYPITGSVGDGYNFATSLGHKVITPRQSLCGLRTDMEVFNSCSGVSFKCKASITNENGFVYCSDFGPIMITNFGVSGPLAFKLSAKFLEYDINGKHLNIDFVNNLTEQNLLEQINNFASSNPKSEIFEFVSQFLIKRLAVSLKQNYEGLLTTKCSELSKEKRQQLVNLLKNFIVKINDFDSFDRAIVTKGGVCVKEINPKTMESKLNEGLYFLGEVLDVDAITGGYSLQIAFSTAYMCGNHINNL